MRATLIEVVGETRGEEMYTLDWLIARVRSHLGPECDANVYLATFHDALIGHAIVRLDADEGEPFGLFSTVYVMPEHRRKNVAEALLRQGEAWMRAQGMTRAGTNTGEHNSKLIGLFEKHGYRVVLRVGEMVHLSRSL